MTHARTALGLVVFLLLSAAVLVALKAREELAQARAALQAGKTGHAVEHLERAIRWYLPGLGTGEEAAQMLWSLADKFEQERKPLEALDGYRRLRAAFYANRHWITPGRDWIERCNRKIAALMAMQTPSTLREAQLSFDQRREHYLHLLERERPPHTGWGLATEAGFFGWVACLVGLIVQGFTRRGEFKARPFFLWLGGFGASYAFWLFCLARV